MAKIEQDQEFVEHIVRQIVANPDDVSTERKVDERGVLITLKINPEDMGYVIGKKGATASAIRTLLKIIGAKNNARVNLKIEDPTGGNNRNTDTADTNTADTDTADIDTSDVDDLQI